jgi:ribose transport system permease protein
MKLNPRLAAVWRRMPHRTFGILLFDIVVMGITGLLAPAFLSTDNIEVILDNMALPAIVLVPTVYLLGAGRFDLSMDGVSALSGMVAGEVMLHGGGIEWAIVAGLAVGLLIGAVNGVLIEWLQLNPLIVTLGTWWIAAGAALGVAHGATLGGFPTSFTSIGQTTTIGLLVYVWYAVPVLVIGGVLLSFTRIGSHVLATGGNREAARLNGLRVRRTGLILFIASGLSASFAGVIFVARLGAATTLPFNGLALQVIAAAVIGGSSLYGGRGEVIGALLGLLLLNVISNAAIYLNISTYWTQTIIGIVLLGAILWEVILASRANRRGMPHRRDSRASRITALLTRASQDQGRADEV